MVIRAKLTVLLCALFGGLFFLAGAPNIASAHPGHNHATGPVHSAAHVPVGIVIVPAAPVEEHGRQRQPTVVESSSQDRATIHLASEPAKAPPWFHAGNCCCGSIACHVGVEAPAMPLVRRRGLGEKFDLPPVLSMPKSVWGGIERPPREQFAL